MDEYLADVVIYSAQMNKETPLNMTICVKVDEPKMDPEVVHAEINLRGISTRERAVEMAEDILRKGFGFREEDIIWKGAP